MRTLLLVLLCLAPTLACAGTPDPDRPLRVLLLGDSISIGYTPAVGEALAGEALVVRPTRPGGGPENCQGTDHGLEHVERWLALEGGGWDVIHVNFGLHDLKRVDPETGRNSNDPAHPHQSPPEEYGAQLATIMERLAASGARLVFATTTPVPPGELRPHREPGDALRYNAAAREVMARLDVPLNDLHAFVSARPAMIRHGDVHYDAEGSRALGERVAAAIREAAGRGPGGVLVEP